MRRAPREFKNCSLKLIRSWKNESYDHRAALECPKSGGDNPTLEVIGGNSPRALRRLESAAGQLCTGCEFSGLTQTEYYQRQVKIEETRIELARTTLARLEAEQELRTYMQRLEQPGHELPPA